ncbi:MAG TPA: LysM domain-containing protein [Burkholderiales bacterium]|nr:LysM domain-containing protein [Burkholderiales bacterium]
MNHFLKVVFGSVLIAGCATPPEPVKEAEPAVPAEQESPPAAEPGPVPPKAEVKPLLTGPAARAEAQKRVRHAFELLNDGNEESASSELKYALELEPDNKAAQCLHRGITADPVAILGRESTSYVVRPGESLGRIAQRALGDVCEFYILARYNQLKVPGRLAAGQTIRIPGKVALAPPDAAPPPASVSSPPPAPAPKPAVEAPAASVPPASAPAAAPSEGKTPRADDAAAKNALIQRHHRNAQAAFRRQDLTTAIREWGRVLEIDPSNELAKVRREEALDLARRLKQIR